MREQDPTPSQDTIPIIGMILAQEQELIDSNPLAEDQSTLIMMDCGWTNSFFFFFSLILLADIKPCSKNWTGTPPLKLYPKNEFFGLCTMGFLVIRKAVSV